MAGQRRSRRLRGASVVAGTILVGVALGGLVLALVLVQITGTASSNEFATTTTTSSTTTTTVAPTEGLQAAVSTTSGGPSACQNALNAGTTALGSVTFDLNRPAPQSYSPENFLCVTNVGPGQISTLTVAAVTTGSSELGCSADEGSVDPEGATCGSNGELDSVLQIVLTPFNLQDGGCVNTPLILIPGESESSLLNTGGTSALSPGNICSWQVQLQLSGTATYDEKLAASTDDVSFTLDVGGSF